MSRIPEILFLPGAGGSPAYWAPVADRLPAKWRRARSGWPGAGDQPHDARVASFDQLIELTRTQTQDRCDLVAHSMGGVVAIGVALRHPERIRRLVLVSTSGGIDVHALGAAEWRDEHRAEFPNAAAWVTEQSVDHTARLGRVSAPTLGATMIRSAPLRPASGWRR